jgi:hypothetical protein
LLKCNINRHAGSVAKQRATLVCRVFIGSLTGSGPTSRILLSHRFSGEHSDTEAKRSYGNDRKTVLL